MKNTRQMQNAGSTTAGGASAASASAPACRRRDARHHDTVSIPKAAALQPVSTIANESSGTPPSRTSGKNGPEV
jgi:hypothetical protein